MSDFHWVSVGQVGSADVAHTVAWNTLYTHTHVHVHV